MQRSTAAQWGHSCILKERAFPKMSAARYGSATESLLQAKGACASEEHRDAARQQVALAQSLPPALPDLRLECDRCPKLASLAPVLAALPRSLTALALSLGQGWALPDLSALAELPVRSKLP